MQEQDDKQRQGGTGVRQDGCGLMQEQDDKQHIGLHIHRGDVVV